MSDKKEQIRADHIIKALRKKYDGDKYARFEQLRNRTGFAMDIQTIDFAVVHLWPSEGLTRTAFEVKVSRSDFTREIERPNKNQFFRDHFHEFWYATAPGVIHDIREVPEECGWLELRGDKLVKKLIAKRKDKPLMDELLLASFCRNVNQELKIDEDELRKKFLAECVELHQLRVLETAVKRFAKERGGFVHKSENEDKIFSALMSCLEERDQRRELEVLSELQNKLFDVWSQLTPLVAVGLREIDDAGQKLHKLYGNDKLFGIARARIESHPRFKEKIDALDELAGKTVEIPDYDKSPTP